MSKQPMPSGLPPQASNRGKTQRSQKQGRAHSVNMTGAAPQNIPSSLAVQMQAQSATVQAARNKLASQIHSNNPTIQM